MQGGSDGLIRGGGGRGSPAKRAARGLKLPVRQRKSVLFWGDDDGRHNNLRESPSDEYSCHNIQPSASGRDFGGRGGAHLRRLDVPYYEGSPSRSVAANMPSWDEGKDSNEVSLTDALLQCENEEKGEQKGGTLPTPVSVDTGFTASLSCSFADDATTSVTPDYIVHPAGADEPNPDSKELEDGSPCIADLEEPKLSVFQEPVVELAPLSQEPVVEPSPSLGPAPEEKEEEKEKEEEGNRNLVIEDAEESSIVSVVDDNVLVVKERGEEETIETSLPEKKGNDDGCCDNWVDESASACCATNCSATNCTPTRSIVLEFDPEQLAAEFMPTGWGPDHLCYQMAVANDDELSNLSSLPGGVRRKKQVESKQDSASAKPTQDRADFSIKNPVDCMLFLCDDVKILLSEVAKGVRSNETAKGTVGSPSMQSL